MPTYIRDNTERLALEALRSRAPSRDVLARATTILIFIVCVLSLFLGIILTDELHPKHEDVKILPGITIPFGP